MTAQELFFDVFFGNDPHRNASEVLSPAFWQQLPAKQKAYKTHTSKSFLLAALFKL